MASFQGLNLRHNFQIEALWCFETWEAYNFQGMRAQATCKPMFLFLKISKPSNFVV